MNARQFDERGPRCLAETGEQSGEHDRLFRAPYFTAFSLDPTRKAEVLNRVLGDDFRGTVTSDYYAAYRRYLKTHPLADAQFCLAHLVQEANGLLTTMSLPGN